jgi:hypothetical protein
MTGSFASPLSIFALTRLDSYKVIKVPPLYMFSPAAPSPRTACTHLLCVAYVAARSYLLFSKATSTSFHVQVPPLTVQWGRSYQRSNA